MRARRAFGSLLLLLSALPATAGEPFYYYVKDGNVVITNTVPRKDARPLPGSDAPEPRAGRRFALDRPAELPPSPYDPHIQRVSAETGLAADLIKSVALVESALDPRAVSSKGAQGLMQLMPATARSYGVTDLFDPLQNLRAGARHLRGLLDRYDGNLDLALAAYNAGESAVERYGGIPAYRETRDYVRKVRARLYGTDDGPPARRVRSEPAPDPVRLVRGSDGSVLLAN